MISQRTIDQIKEAATIEQLVGEHVELKKRGSSFLGCCPFHQEKTPSFTVTPAKGIYKCFGCGKAGDAISFIREIKGVSYPDALRLLADKYNIEVEEIGGDNEVERKEHDDYSAVTSGALGHYVRELHKKPQLIRQIREERGIDYSTILDFQLGYAPDDFKFLIPKIVDKGYIIPATKLGIVRTKDGNNYDFFRNRVMVPIFNMRGTCIGFGGRKLEDDNKENPKWTNSSECVGFFEKRNVLFGLNLAAPAIRKKGYAILVEGYMDVIGFYDSGMENTVASMGTAFTDGQAKQIRKYTDTLVIARDADKAGQKSASEAVETCLRNGIKPFYLPFPEGEDPGSFAKRFKEMPIATKQAFNWSTIVQYANDYTKDAVEWRIAERMARVKGVVDKDSAADELEQLLILVKSDVRRDAYLSILKNDYDLNIAKRVNKKAKAVEEEEEEDISEREASQRLAHLKWLTKEKKEEAFFKDGFTTCEEFNHFGYWFGTPGFNIEQLTNFIIKPLFSINEPVEKFELAEIVNRHGSTILEVPAGTFTSMNAFEKLIWEARATVLNSFSQQHLRKLNAKNIYDFKQATLVRTLGMQPEGFWSYADAIIYDGKIIRYDKTGIATVGNTHFYSPGAADHNRNKRKDEWGNEVTEGDPYRNDKALNYKPAAVTFEQWAQQIIKVFGPKGMNLISTVILAVFKDIVTAFEKLPIAYGFGDAEAGKSVWAERILYFFFDSETKPYNLNTGTIFAFFNTMERFRNCAFVFNEFDEDTINDEFFRAFKQAHDGEGRAKGMVGTNVKNKSTTQDINIVPVIVGQILSTKDGGSVLSRCVPEKFVARTYSPEEVENLNELKRWEKKGLNGAIIELLTHRAKFRRDFLPTFNSILADMKADITKNGGVYKERIARNHCIMLACAKIIGSHFKLGFTDQEYYSWMLASVTNLTEMVNESNNLGTFWRELAFMYEQMLIEEGYDYKVEIVSQVTISVTQDGKKVDIVKRFDQPKKLLFLRLTSVFPLFETRIKQSSGNKSINKKTLETYFESTKAYLGNNPTGHYRSAKRGTLKTSAFVFDYDMLGLNLERNGAAEEERKLEVITGRITTQPERVLLGPEASAVKFTITHYTQTTTVPARTITLYTSVFCPSELCPAIEREEVVTVTGYLTVVETGSMQYKRTVRSIDATVITKGEPKVDEALDDPFSVKDNQNNEIGEETFDFPE